MIPLPRLGSALVLAILVLAGCTDRRETPAPDLTAVQEQLADLERRFEEQARRHAEDTQLMVRALDASSQRLDRVIGALLSGAKAPTKTVSPVPNEAPDTKVGQTDQLEPAAVTKPNVATPPAGETTGETTGDKTGDTTGETASAPAGGDGAQTAAGFNSFEFLVIFLTVALLLLVLIVVFFPGRLRGSVPQVEYSALDDDSIDAEAIAGLQDDGFAHAESMQRTDPVAPGPSAFEPPAATGIDEVAPVAGVDPASTGGAVPEEDRPVMHELAIRAPNPEDLTDLAEVLDRFLSTDPYILNQPPPQVALDAGELRLRFYAVPTLSESEHGLLDEAIRRLTPRTDEPSARGGGGHRGVG